MNELEQSHNGCNKILSMVEENWGKKVFLLLNLTNSQNKNHKTTSVSSFDRYDPEKWVPGEIIWKL